MITVLRSLASPASDPSEVIAVCSLTEALTTRWPSQDARGAMLAPYAPHDGRPARRASKADHRGMAWSALAFDVDCLKGAGVPPWTKPTWWDGATGDGPADDPSWTGADALDRALALAREAVPGGWAGATTPSGFHLYLPLAEPVSLERYSALHAYVTERLNTAGVPVDPATEGNGVAWRVFNAPHTTRNGRALSPSVARPGAPWAPDPAIAPVPEKQAPRAPVGAVPTHDEDTWGRIFVDAWYGPHDPSEGSGLAAHFDKRPDYADLAESMRNRIAFAVGDGQRNARLVQRLPAMVVGLLTTHRKGLSAERYVELAWSVLRTPLLAMGSWGVDHAGRIQSLICQYATAPDLPRFPAIFNWGASYLLVDRTNERLIPYNGAHLGRVFAQINGLSLVLRDKDQIMEYGTVATGYGVYGSMALVEDVAEDHGFFAVRANGDIAAIGYHERAEPLADPDACEAWEEFCRLVDPSGRLRAYLSIVGDVGSKAPILLLHGTGGAGKSFISQSILRYFKTSEYVNWETARDYTFGWEVFAKTPFVMFEEAPKLSAQDIQLLKEKSMSGKQAIQVKGLPQITVHAYPRIVVTTNEADILRIPRGMSQEVIEPLRRRLLALSIPSEITAVWLAARVDVCGGLEAAHTELSRWIASIQVPRSTVRDSEVLAIDPLLAEHMYGGSHDDSATLAAIATAVLATPQADHIAQIVAGELWVRVTSEAIHEAWRAISRDPTPTVGEIAASVPWYRANGRKVLRKMTSRTGRHAFARVHVERVAVIAEQRGLIDRAADFLDGPPVAVDTTVPRGNI